MIPISEATGENLGEIRNVAVQDDTFASKFDVTIENDSGSTQHTDRGDSVAPIAGAAEIANVSAGAETLFTSFEGRTVIHANAIGYPVGPSDGIIATVISAIVPAISAGIVIGRNS